MKRKSRFFNEIIAAFLTYLVGCFFSYVLIGTSGNIDLLSNAALQNAIVGIVTTVVTLTLVFFRLWYKGEYDCNLVDFGHMKKNLGRGALIGLFSAIPKILMLTAFLLAAKSYSLAVPLAVLFSPFIGWVGAVQVPAHYIYSVIILTYIGVCAAGYYCGFNGIAVTKNLFYKKEK